MGNKHLTDKERAFIEHYVATGSPEKAYILAGYDGKFAKSNGVRLLKKSIIEKEIAVISLAAARELEKKSVYSLSGAMAHANGARERAIINKQCNAEVKAVELMAKLHGLLIERQEIRTDSFQLHIHKKVKPKEEQPIEVESEVVEDEDDLFS